MDTTAKSIVFDIKGNCNFCNDFLQILEKPKFKIDLSLNDLVNKIKKDGEKYYW